MAKDKMIYLELKEPTDETINIVGELIMKYKRQKITVTPNEL